MSNNFEPFPELFKILRLFVSDFEVHRFNGLNKIGLFFHELSFLNSG